jgi:hypothetical protein
MTPGLIFLKLRNLRSSRVKILQQKVLGEGEGGGGGGRRKRRGGKREGRGDARRDGRLLVLFTLP